MKKLFVLVACLCLVTAFAVFGMGKKNGGSAGSEVGSQAPDFTLTDMNGENVSLSDYRGNVVFLNFWATWCPPCREEMPSMERLHESMGGKDFVILAVNVEKDKEAVESFLRGSPYSFKILLDPEGEAQSAYRVYRYPESYLIDKDGKILEHYLGARDWSSVDFLNHLKDIVGK
ncbi:MAG TPA: TlpA disulfide reductase family protein [Desulfuromonadales bacterium]|nr:TlpA disulfide reductase family protein [Desulfuromonadales bacterium]